ncbi:hypothetical protein N657DRAFT_639995 [Parathielavia appendiculata]|uniref:Uncharacterized protein n=1 Tax=Parathielavia appendiculata TaxID=2587402 RepID=A0AAN6Z9M9_9PEZI|nr:hypothetical protein N657DRAFT_639995 [Parathielavia appendiculata]
MLEALRRRPDAKLYSLSHPDQTSQSPLGSFSFFYGTGSTSPSKGHPGAPTPRPDTGELFGPPANTN